MGTRREFCQWAAAALGGSSLMVPGAGAEARGLAEGTDRGAGPQPGGSPSKTGSDVGSLFPFIQSQAVRSNFPLSFLGDGFKDLAAWKKRARGKLLDLLHYAPARCDSRPEVVEKTDRG